MDNVEVSSSILENDLEVELLTLRGQYLKKLMKCENNPYFGRVDFNGDKIYIGITYLDKNNEHLVHLKMHTSYNIADVSRIFLLHNEILFQCQLHHQLL